MSQLESGLAHGSSLLAPRPAPRREPVIFAGLRSRVMANGVSVMLHRSRLRLTLILLFSLVFWLGLFGMFFEGFQFLDRVLGVKNDIVGLLLGLLFLWLFVMLLFSSGIIAYHGLFKSREAGFLRTLPARPDHIFAYKLQEAIGFSSWGFVLLGSPMMIAYGISSGAPWYYYGMLMGYMLAFILIPGGLGAIVTLLVVAYFPRRTRDVLIGLIAAGVAGMVWTAARAVRQADTGSPVLDQAWLDNLMATVRFSSHPLLPSEWLSAGLVALAQGAWATGLFYFGVLLSQGLAIYLAATALARLLYERGYSRIQGGRAARQRHSLYFLDAGFDRVFWFIPRRIRILICKDLRTFRRDPAQWLQFLIFFGLLAVYFLNIQRLGYGVQRLYWRNLVSFLNLSVTALILSTFTSRFIFPLLSLEGKNLWVLGLLPLDRGSIVYGKFAFALGISAVASEMLVILSDLMLKLDRSMVLLHMMTIFLLCAGLAAISVGLGARLPNLKEDDPSKIAVGFGGTLNLLVSLVFIFVVVFILALPCHLYFAGQDVQRDPEWASTIGSLNPLSLQQFRFWLGVSVGTSLVISLVATIIPLRIGARAFRTMEF